MDNARLDSMGFTPFAKVVGGDSLRIMAEFYGGYGETVDQGQLQIQGDEYLKQNFPRLDRILTAEVESSAEERR